MGIDYGMRRRMAETYDSGEELSSREQGRRRGELVLDARRRTAERRAGQKVFDIEKAAQRKMRSNDQIILERFGDTGIRMGDFVGIYPASKIVRDQEYTLDRGASYELNTSENVAAKRLEEIFLEGVNVGGLLGRESLSRDGAFAVEARHTTKYDDTTHRIDAMVDLDFKEPIESYDGETSISNVTMGIDVTTASSSRVLFDKLTKSYNSSYPQLPFGFSQITYYQRGEEREQKKIVPRFTIALSADVVNQLWNSATVVPGQNNSVRDFHAHSELMLKTRFKILSEFRAQNLLRTAMLPDDQEDEPARTAAMQTDAIDECLDEALRDCAKEMIARKYVPASVIKQSEKSQVATIEDYIMQESDPRIRTPHGIKDLAFVNCMKYTRDLMNAAYISDPDNPTRQLIDQHRIVGSHNQAFAVPPVGR